MKLNDAAKEIGEDVVGLIGVVEIVLGSVGGYVLWLTFKAKPEVADMLQTTGNAAIDTALLVLLASLLGKVLHIIVGIPIVLILGFLRMRALKGDLGSLRCKLKSSHPSLKNMELLDAATELITYSDPASARDLVRLRDSAIISLFMAIATTVVAWDRVGWNVYGIVLLLVAGALVIYCLITLQDYMATLTSRLERALEDRRQ